MADNNVLHTEPKKEETDTNQEYLNGLSGNETVSTGNEQSTYDYLRSASAKELLDSNIQLSIARQNSARALQSQNAAMGLNGTGYAGVQAVGLQNAYLNGLTANEQQYANTLNDIAVNEENEFSNDVSALGSAIASAADKYQLEQYAKNYGLTPVYDDTGSLVSFKGDMWDKMNNSQKSQILSFYTSNTEVQPGYSDVNQALAGWRMENGESVVNGQWGIDREINYIFSPTYKDKATNGQIVILQNNRGSNNFKVVKFVNGKWVESNMDAFLSQYDKGGKVDLVTNGHSMNPEELKVIIDRYKENKNK